MTELLTEQAKTPVAATTGVFYTVLGGWFKPKAGYQLFPSVQPFANVVGNYTRQNREEKWQKFTHDDHPLPLPA